MIVKAAGLVIYREAPSRIYEFLLLKCARAGHWTPPKGHVNVDEDEKATAMREAEEESGLCRSDYSIVDKFEHVLKYQSAGRDGNKEKTVKYWLAKLKNSDVQIKMSSEHSAFDWFTVKSLTNGVHSDKLIHDGTKSILKSAEDFLNRR